MSGETLTDVMWRRRYWDNVAGPTLDAALTHMATDGLIIVRIFLIKAHSVCL